MAYSQAIRIGESGYTTISEFGRSLAPPPSRSTIAFPLALAFSVAVVSMVFMPMMANLLPVTWLKGLESFDKPIVIGSLILGAIVGFRLAAEALIHNESVHRGEMDEWARGVVCRRCGQRFKR